MDWSLTSRFAPRCFACLRRQILAASDGFAASSTPARQQQVRGKKKLAKSPTVTVRLLKNVKSFGPKGSLVPTPRGRMRSKWFPERIAEYVTVPELQKLRESEIAPERDFTFGVLSSLAQTTDETAALENAARMSTAEIQSASAFQREPALAKLTPGRSVELVEIFVPHRIDFYRQPIIEEPEAVPEPEQAQPQRQQRFGRGAAADLLAARMPVPEKASSHGKDKDKPVAIYGSVSTQDVLIAARATMANNEEAARVVLGETDIQFVDLPQTEGAEVDKHRVKHVGDFVVEIRVKGADKVVRRTTRVIAQDA